MQATEAVPVGLSTSEAAARANRSRSAVDRAMREGRLPFAWGTGHTRVLLAEDVDEWAEREREGTP
jgi:excisionase family DNA binding protein